jgi:protease I
MPDPNGKTLSGKTVAFLVAPEGVEQIELTEPWQAVEEADGTPRLVSTKPGRIQAFHHLDKGDTFEVDDLVADADPSAYDGLVLPGGVANPDALRMDKQWTSCARSSRAAGRSRRSATRRGRWSRPTSSATGR